MDKSTNAVAYAPGYYIRDILTTLNISYNDFAQKMDMNLDEVTQLILGECELNEEIAKKLEAFFHVEASRWLTLEKQYRMTKKFCWHSSAPAWVWRWVCRCTSSSS